MDVYDAYDNRAPLLNESAFCFSGFPGVILGFRVSPHEPYRKTTHFVFVSRYTYMELTSTVFVKA
jgi:hypothetical protein